MSFLKRLFCTHKNLVFSRNLYGDEINEWGGKRAVWVCTKCGVLVGKESLEKTE